LQVFFCREAFSERNKTSINGFFKQIQTDLSVILCALLELKKLSTLSQQANEKHSAAANCSKVKSFLVHIEAISAFIFNLIFKSYECL
jgi:hypothetical protein